MTGLLKALLVLVFAGAGIGKLTDREGSVEEMKAFGVPAPLAPAVAWALPFVELAVAVAILVPAISRWGALAGLGLLLSYTAAIALNMALGRKPECKCFGALYALPIGWKALLRNVLFSAAAFALYVRA
ncbi:MAG: MauE/DoxX family redox-associated membrane protein [Actinomycetota bacterium]